MEHDSCYRGMGYFKTVLNEEGSVTKEEDSFK